MAKLTSQEANELGKNFLSIAQEIGDYRYEYFDDLTTAQNRKLREYHKRVLNYSDDLFTLSATLVLDDVQTSLTLIDGITVKIKDTYKALQNVQKAIKVAASVVTFGASIFSKNPHAIADSMKKLINVIDS